MNDKLLTTYLEEIDDINWLLAVREATSRDKLDLIIEQDPLSANRTCRKFWAFGNEELISIKTKTQTKINQIILQVDLTPIL